MLHQITNSKTFKYKTYNRRVKGSIFTQYKIRWKTIRLHKNNNYGVTWMAYK